MEEVEEMLVIFTKACNEWMVSVGVKRGRVLGDVFLPYLSVRSSGGR